MGVATAIVHFVTGATHRDDAVMLYLLTVVVVAMTLGRAPSVVATVLSTVALDFFFTRPFLSFVVSDFATSAPSPFCSSSGW